MLFVHFHKLDVPGPPGIPVVTDIQKRSVSLKWKEPKDDGGSPLTGYEIEYRMEGAFKWVSGNGGEKVTDTKYTITGLKDNMAYEFRIAATNLAGVGAFVEMDSPVKVKEPIGEYWDFFDCIK